MVISQAVHGGRRDRRGSLPKSGFLYTRDIIICIDLDSARGRPPRRSLHGRPIAGRQYAPDTSLGHGLIA
jgi:hypothetical protein